LFILTLVANNNHRLLGWTRNNLEWPQFNITLNRGIRKSATNQPLCIEDGVDRVHGDLVLGGIADQTLGVGEPNVRRRCSVSLVIGDDFNTVVLPDTDA